MALIALMKRECWHMAIKVPLDTVYSMGVEIIVWDAFGNQKFSLNEGSIRRHFHLCNWFSRLLKVWIILKMVGDSWTYKIVWDIIFYYKDRNEEIPLNNCNYLNNLCFNKYVYSNSYVYLKQMSLFKRLYLYEKTYFGL